MMGKRNAYAMAARLGKGGPQDVPDVRDSRAPGHHAPVTGASYHITIGDRIRNTSGNTAQVVGFNDWAFALQEDGGGARIVWVRKETIDRDWERDNE